MASAELKRAARCEWAPGNPWFWMAAGLLMTSGAWILRLLTDRWSPLLVGVGLLACGIGLAIRLNSGGPAFLENYGRGIRGLVLLALALTFGALGTVLTVALVLRIGGWANIPWRPGGLSILWLVVAPMSFIACKMCLQHPHGQPLSAAEESTALLACSGLAAALGCWGMEWETIQLFLAVLAAVCLAAAPLMVVPQKIRRRVLSLLVLLHFGGITTAVLATPPVPWLVSEIWTRVFRPYLEFMYLNNAYHFYAPDPGNASYVWFRLQYLDENEKVHGHWVKIPEFDENGRHVYPTGLEYSRYLALSERSTYLDQTPLPLYEIVKEKGQMQVAPAGYLKRRQRHSPGYTPMVGEIVPRDGLIVPLNPDIPLQQQYQVPSREVKDLMESYARHVCRIPHPEHPEWRIFGVKIYRVLHLIPSDSDALKYFLDGGDPREPVFYRPFFMGEYDCDGNLVDANEPFLYWMLPIIQDAQGRVMDFARKHAGDPRWIRLPETKQWSEGEGLN
jgi:hypothetical protein